MDQQINRFSFVGTLPASKSLYNRLLIVKSFFPSLLLHGHSTAQDVVKMQMALTAATSVRDCGAAGTVLRFLALRLARDAGLYELTGSERLFSRPQQGLIRVLAQLGCQCELSANTLRLRSWGWKMVGDQLHVPMDQSSQLASAVLLSAWQLPQALFLRLDGELVSRDYLLMTVKLLRELGMQIEWQGRELRVLPRQELKVMEKTIEPDLSSCFSLAACAAVAGQVKITGMPQVSLQPDRVFIELLKKMNVDINQEGDCLKVRESSSLKPLQADLRDTPDLFPVLAALCALAEGTSELRGAPHLQHKESHRLQRLADLLRLCGREVLVYEDGLKIFGKNKKYLSQATEFNPDQDHRLAMAAAVLQKAGEPLLILHKEVVNKSYPGFWHDIGESA